MVILQILIIALLFTLVVGAHELGHYLFAKWRGMEVEEFALGFGPKIASKRSKAGTEFTIRAFPLGGFIRTKGMEPKPDGSEVNVPNGFYSKGLWSRALVLFAGPLFSVLFGWLLFFGDAAAFGWKDAPYIGEVSAGDPAERAGLRAGDRIVAMDGSAIVSFREFAATMRESEGEPVAMTMQRGDEVFTVQLTAEFRKPTLTDEIRNSEEYRNDPEVREALEEERWLVGISAGPPRSVGLGEAASVATAQTWFIISETGKALANPARLKEEAGGVIAIGQAAGAAVSRGLSYFLVLAGLISVSLGLINLLPIPILDGGQLLIVAIEALRGGRRLSLKTQEALGFVGILIIAALFLTVTFLDIGRLMN